MECLEVSITKEYLTCHFYPASGQTTLYSVERLLYHVALKKTNNLQNDKQYKNTGTVNASSLVISGGPKNGTTFDWS